MSDLISKQDAIDAIESDIAEIDPLDLYYGIKKASIRRAAWRVSEVPSAEKTGKRIVDMEIDFLGEKTMWYVCDQCRKPIDAEDKYCKHCGARMVGDEE